MNARIRRRRVERGLSTERQRAQGVEIHLARDARGFREIDLRDVGVRAIDAPTPFRDFDDYWTPFLGGQGPAPAYCMSLDEGRRAALRDRIRSRLPFGADGSIHLVARAWAVKGTVG